MVTSANDDIEESIIDMLTPNDYRLSQNNDLEV